jgi:hypothetical protein
MVVPRVASPVHLEEAMRNITLVGIVAGAGLLALTQMASADRVCRQVCDGGACVEKCVEHEDRVIIDRDRAPPPAVGLRAPGVNVEIGR